MKIPTRKVPLLAALFTAALLSACESGETDPPGDEMPPPAPVPQCSESETQRLAEGVYSFRRGLYSTMFVVGRLMP